MFYKSFNRRNRVQSMFYYIIFQLRNFYNNSLKNAKIVGTITLKLWKLFKTYQWDMYCRQFWFWLVMNIFLVNYAGMNLLKCIFCNEILIFVVKSFIALGKDDRGSKRIILSSISVLALNNYIDITFQITFKMIFYEISQYL